MKTDLIGARVEESLKERFIAACARMNKDQSVVLRALILAFLAKGGKL